MREERELKKVCHVFIKKAKGNISSLINYYYENGIMFHEFQITSYNFINVIVYKNI